MGRTSIPCSDETRDELADLKPEGATWDEFLLALADVEPFEEADHAQLADEINSLRRELDEFKHQLPEQVAQELRH